MREQARQRNQLKRQEDNYLPVHISKPLREFVESAFGMPWPPPKPGKPFIIPGPSRLHLEQEETE
jgi:hypothetical protein